MSEPQQIPTQTLPPMNGFQHPWTRQATVMTDEDRINHLAFAREYVQALDPYGLLEINLARTLALDYWRLHRIKAVEENLFALGECLPARDIETEHAPVHHALLQADVFARQFKALNFLSLYEQRLTRNIHQNTKLFFEIQDRRRAREDKDDRQNRRAACAAARQTEEPAPKTRTAGAGACSVVPFPDAVTAQTPHLSARSEQTEPQSPAAAIPSCV